MNFSLYQKMLKITWDHVRKLKFNQKWALQHYNDPKYSSKSTKEWMKKRNGKCWNVQIKVQIYILLRCFGVIWIHVIKPLKHCIAEEILQGEARKNSFQPNLRLFLAKGADNIRWQSQGVLTFSTEGNGIFCWIKLLQSQLFIIFMFNAFTFILYIWFGWR